MNNNDLNIENVPDAVPDTADAVPDITDAVPDTADAVPDAVPDTDTATNNAKTDFLPPELITAICQMPFNFLASKYGSYWALSDNEAQLLGSAVNNVLAKYLPEWLNKHSAEATLLLTLAMIVTPRIMHKKPSVQNATKP